MASATSKKTEPKLIGVARASVAQQLRQLEQQFLQEGGFTERLYRTRIEARKRRE